ncbi:MAG TPA: hypothetical protein ENJ95_08030 [Bacteroidetes bacterium]|nr:hypothetical protein [Bacteroidota bacterium]
MNTLRTFFISAFFSFSTLIIAQPDDAQKALHFTLQQLPDQSWGVFVQPDDSIFPSERTSTGSGQVTIVAPIDFVYSNLENRGGSWVENARVNGPQEAADRAYISFGFVTDKPKLEILPNEETLLFTFTTNKIFDGTFSLFENGVDAFATPNSYGTNPGNDLGIIDMGAGGGLQFYAYAGNYENNNPQAVFASNKKKNKRDKKNADGALVNIQPK